jgi:sugar porter (SP) family MFS transporter
MANKKILFFSIIVALAGFLFGFDTVVISGADIALQKLWPYGEVFHGFVIMSSALWGTVIGAIFGSLPADALGRKKTLILIGIFYFISALGSALAQGPWMFAFFRFIGGLAIGASTIAAPAYISEISPAHNRGKLVALYQLNIVLGILIAFLSNFLLSDIGEQSWRWMLGIQVIPAIVYSALVWRIPESPRWLLIRKKDRQAATKVFTIISPSKNAEEVIQSILNAQTSSGRKESIFMQKYRLPLILAFLIAFFNQFSGINAFLYYAPRIFEMAGLEKSSALLSSVGIGVTNLIFTFVGMYLIDRIGRRQLMYIGSIGYIISLSMIAFAFYDNWQGMAVPGFLFLFIASHAIGQGTVIWVFIAEIFPNHLRADGQAFGSSVHWVLAASIPSLMPLLIKTIGITAVFAFFALMMVLQLLFVWRMMPETKGTSLEDLEKNLATSTH